MKVVRVLLVAGCLLSLAVAASAATATGTMGVSATVAGSCAIAGEMGTNMGFGTYVPGSLAVQSLATIEAVCTNGIEARILLDEGQNPGPGSSLLNPQRRMADNFGDYLNYQLYVDNSYSSVWDGVNGVSYFGVGFPTGVTVYGEVPSGQNVPSGDYGDLITVTISY